jgi:hypothetical protein
MTVSSIETARLRLVSPDASCLELLPDGVGHEAAESLGMSLPPGLGASSEGLLRIRLADLRALEVRADRIAPTDAKMEGEEARDRR